MKPSILVCASASSGTSTRAPYWPLPRMTSSIGSIPASITAQTLGVEGVVLAGRAGQVPGVHEDVAGEELRDGLRAAGRRPDVRVAEHPVGRGRVVEERLHLALEVVPGAGRVVVHRRAGAGGARPAPAARNDGNHSTRWRTTSRAAHSSTGDGSSHWSGHDAGHDVAEPAADLTELLRRCVGRLSHVGQTRSFRRTHRLATGVDRASLSRHRDRARRAPRPPRPRGRSRRRRAGSRPCPGRW